MGKCKNIHIPTCMLDNKGKAPLLCIGPFPPHGSAQLTKMLVGTSKS